MAFPGPTGRVGHPDLTQNIGQTRCMTPTRERSRQDWRGDRSPIPNELARPTNCDPGPAAAAQQTSGPASTPQCTSSTRPAPGDNLGDVVDAYAAVAQAASELADALQAAGE